MDKSGKPTLQDASTIQTAAADHGASVSNTEKGSAIDSPFQTHSTDQSDAQAFHVYVQNNRDFLKKHLPEMYRLDKLMDHSEGILGFESLAYVSLDDQQYPIPFLTLGNLSQCKTIFFITAAIHGVERIGTQALLAWLQTVIQRHRWDALWRGQFEQDIAIAILPMVNPTGMIKNTRCNGNGVDLNRHAPIDAEDPVPFLLGGQRISKHIPWYRGRKGVDAEIEFQILEKTVDRLTQTGKPVIALDIHSGFGFRDQLWIPYAYRKQPINDVAIYMALKILWERNYPHHNYAFEPQSSAYLSHGDVWDYFHRKVQAEGNLLLPLTLEMGSWNWVKKRPVQLLSFSGLFHPTVPHRHARVLRQHLGLLDFLLAATRNFEAWRPRDDQWYAMEQVALSMWYKN